MRKLIFIIFFLTSTSFAKTIIKIHTSPIQAIVICNGEKKGIAPTQFLLEDGKYQCSLTHKLTESIIFSFDVSGEKSISANIILTPGRMTKMQKNISLHRVLRNDKTKKDNLSSSKDYSKEAEEYVLSKKGAEAQQLINKLVELKQTSSDGGPAVTASELSELKSSGKSN